MSELGTLFVILLLIYLAQCVWWAPPGAVIFALGWRGAGRRKQQGFVWNALDLAGTLANPLPPLAPLVVSEWPGFQPEAERFIYTPRGGEPVSAAWENLKITVSDTRLLCNGDLALKAGEAQARCYAEFLREVAGQKPPKRGRTIEAWLRMSTDEAATRQRIETFQKKSRWLRIAGNVEFLLLFVVAPLAFRTQGPRALWPVVAALAAMAVSITWEFWTLHRALFPEAGGARLKSGLTILLSPLAAVRAGDAVSRDLVSGFHPLAVAAAVLPDDEFRTFAGEQLRACRFGTLSDWYRERLRKALEALARRKGLQPEQLLAPPERQGNCVAFCPRCLAQYMNNRSECADCGYTSLLALTDGR